MMRTDRGSVTRLAVRGASTADDTSTMSAPGLVMHLLGAGIPPSLLIDLYDVDGMRAALTAELAETDAAAALASGVVGLTVLPSRRALGVA
jgi:hypothetical protein